MGDIDVFPNSAAFYTLCTSSTRPASPFEGQMIYETDRQHLLIYDGTNWYNPMGMWWQVGGTSHATLSGTTPTAAQMREYPLLTQMGSSVQVLGFSSQNINFPVPFPNGLFNVMLTQGDGSAGAADFVILASGATTSGFTVTFYEHDGTSFGAVNRRCNWVAYGW